MRVVVVGGGLAGMIAARECGRRGHEVVLLEKSVRLGGKAGSDVKGGRRVEHGYHVFPKWYPNVRGLLDEIGTKLVDFDRYHYLVSGKFPSFVTVRGPSDLGAIWHNTVKGILPWYQTILFFGFTIDLLSKSLSNKKLLDRVSQIGLMREAWYVTEEVAELNQENLLKASAIPAYDMSAMTAKNIGGYWLRQASPFLSVLPGDLQTTFIDPLERTLLETANPVTIRRETGVKSLDVEGSTIVSVTTESGETITGDAFVLATPFEVSRKFVDGKVFELDPTLGDMYWLEAQPMAAIHVRLSKKLDSLPKEHVFFHGGLYGLSFIDVAQIWKDHDVPTELSFIASNFAPLSSLSNADATEMLLREIETYLPIDRADIQETVLNPNVDVPLFINTIGAWPNRPSPKSKLKNLYVAGDHVKNAIDLACMEGAVSAALEASRQLLRDAGHQDLPEVKVPPVWPRPLLLLAKYSMYPALAVSTLIARTVEFFGGSKANAAGTDPPG